MATTTTRKRTTTAKTASAKTRTVATEKPVVNEKSVEQKKSTVLEKPIKSFKDSDGILCRSVTQGGLYMEGQKTHIMYTWVDYGDTTYVEYADLAAAVRVRSWFVFHPTFIVEDNDFVNEFPQLGKFYAENYTDADLEGILALPVEEMTLEVKALPKSALDELKVIAASGIVNGSFDSVKKIKILDEILGTSLSVLAEFDN